MATVMDTTTARGRLSLLPLLRLPLSPDMDTAMDTAMAATDTTATATERGRLSLPPLLRLLLSPDTDTAATATMDTAMDTVMDTDMATDTAMATATMDREGTDCVSNHDVKSSVK